MSDQSGEQQAFPTQPPVPEAAPGAPPTGYAPPPGGYAPPPAGYAPPPPPPAKKSGCLKGCLITFAIVLVLTVCAVGGVWIALANAGKPKDLGVRYTEADYWNAMAKAGVEVPDPPSGAEDWASTQVVYSGSKPLDATFSDSEVSALFAYSHAPGWPISGAQVRFTGGDGVEMSAAVDFEGTKYPVYCTATAGISGRTVSGSLSSVQFFGQQLPGEYLGAGSEYAAGLINERLSRLEGLDIQTAEVVDGQLHLVGTVPAKAERVPAGQ